MQEENETHDGVILFVTKRDSENCIKHAGGMIKRTITLTNT
jgi:hypothetical protein